MRWLALVLLALCTTSFAATPSLVQANYTITKNGMTAETVETYTRDGDHYQLSSTTTPEGFLSLFKIVLTSRGLINKQGLRPLHFEDKRAVNPGKNSQAEFDWKAQQLTLTHHEQSSKLALSDGTQDRLSAMYQFMFLQLDGKSTLEFAMTNGNKLNNYRYAIGTRIMVDTPAGQFDSLYLDSQAKPGESRTEIWLSTQYNLPCKMIITEANGEQFTQVLSGLKITP